MPKSTPTFMFSCLWKSLFVCCLIPLVSCNSPKRILPPAPSKMTEQEIKELAQEIHKAALVLDAHADIATPTISPTFLSADLYLSRVNITLF